MKSLSNLNKQFNQYLNGGIDFIWRNFYNLEFLRLEYPDHKKQENESYQSYFKRSFQTYLHIRRLLSQIILLTN